MRNLFIATSVAALAVAGTAYAGDIIVSPIQDNPSPAVSATTNLTNVHLSGPNYINATAAENVLSADAGADTVTVTPANFFSPNQLSYGNVGATVNITEDVIAGATINATAIDNQTSLNGGLVNATGAQTSTGADKATVNITQSHLTAAMVIGASAVGNVLTATGNNVNVGYDVGEFPSQGIQGSQTATLNLSKLGSEGPLTGTAQAVGNDIQVTATGAVALNSLQDDGSMYGHGLNSIGGTYGDTNSPTCSGGCYPGSQQTATINASKLGFEGGTTLTATAIGNSLSATGSGITGTFQQFGTNGSQIAVANLSNLGVTGGITVGTVAVANAVSLSTK